MYLCMYYGFVVHLEPDFGFIITFSLFFQTASDESWFRGRLFGRMQSATGIWYRGQNDTSIHTTKGQKEVRFRLRLYIFGVADHHRFDIYEMFLIKFDNFYQNM